MRIAFSKPSEQFMWLDLICLPALHIVELTGSIRYSSGRLFCAINVDLGRHPRLQLQLDKGLKELTSTT
jgi:hypothetical protein